MEKAGERVRTSRRVVEMIGTCNGSLLMLIIISPFKCFLAKPTLYLEEKCDMLELDTRVVYYYFLE